MTEITQQIKELSLEIGRQMGEAGSTAERIADATSTLASETADILSPLNEPETELLSFSASIEAEASSVWDKGQQDIEEAVEAVATGLINQTTLATETVAAASAQISEWTEFENSLSDTRRQFRDMAENALQSERDLWLDQANKCVSVLGQQEDALRELASSLSDFGNDASSSFAGTLASWRDEHAAQINQFNSEQTSKVTDTFNQCADAIATAYRTEADRLGNVQDLLVSSVDQASSDWINGEKEKFIEALEDIVKREIAEAIVVSQFGAATTAALTPHLPAMIVVKHAADTLLELIEIWKELKEPFGI